MRDEIFQRLAELGVLAEEVVERFARASGPGGQHVNKTSSAVTLVCERLSLTVSVQDTRSQARNRELAWERLIHAIEELRKSEAARRKALREKERRRHRKRPRALQERILESKRRRSETKRLRAKPQL